MITMSEIAKLTHVSQPTVSRVLNGNPRVDPEIRRRVLACAKEHHYQFNALAKSLHGRGTMLLGVLLTDISNSFFAELAKQIELAARKRGYSIILFNSGYDAEKEQRYLDILRQYRVDGVLVVPILQGSSYWPECAGRLDVPLVSVTRRVEGLDSVYLNHEDASGQVAKHLLERGCGRFLFIGRNMDMKYLGFRQGLLDRGANCRITCMEEREDCRLKRELQSYLDIPGPKPGIFANNDVCALRVLRILRELGISVPEDAGVVGFDNTYMAGYLNPALTSVSQPVDRMAEEAVARLVERIECPEQAVALNLELSASLVVRESS